MGDTIEWEHIDETGESFTDELYIEDNPTLCYMAYDTSRGAYLNMPHYDKSNRSISIHAID